MARVELYSAVGDVAFWTRLAIELRHRGYEVESHHALTSTEYRNAKGRLARLRLRWHIYAWFGCRSAWRLAFRKRSVDPVVHVVTTNPFYLPLIIAYLAGWRNEKSVYLVFDLFPDALAVARWRWTPWLKGPLGWITRESFRRSTAAVFLGSRIQEYAGNRYGHASLSVVIPVGADGSPFREHPPRLVRAGESIKVVYVGIMGRMHEVGTLVDLLGSALPNGVVMSFYASGSGYMELRRRTLQMHADYYGPLLEADWVRCLHDSHVGLITLEPGAEKVAMPSKTYSALVAGQAIIAVCPETSDLAALVQTHDCGWVVPPGDAKKLREVLVAIEADRELLYNKRRRAFAVAHAYYDMTPICSRWTALLQELIDQNVGASVASGKARPLI